MEFRPSDKMAVINDLVQRGYNLCFLFDQLVNDYITNAEMVDFGEYIKEKFPNPLDTTGRYTEPPTPKEGKACKILSLTLKRP